MSSKIYPEKQSIDLERKVIHIEERCMSCNTLTTYDVEIFVLSKDVKQIVKEIKQPTISSGLKYFTT